MALAKFLSKQVEKAYNEYAAANSKTSTWSLQGDEWVSSKGGKMSTRNWDSALEGGIITVTDVTDEGVTVTFSESPALSQRGTLYFRSLLPKMEALVY